MRTTIDLPEDLYRGLKARAGLAGITLRELVQELIERGLRAPAATTGTTGRSFPPPVIIPATGVPIRALSAAELRRIDEEEDEAKACAT